MVQAIDIKQKLKIMNDNVSEIYDIICIYFINYYPKHNISKNAIEFYENENDYQKSKAKKRGFTPPYAMIMNVNHVLFYFKKRSELPVSQFQELQKDFGADKVEEKDGLHKNVAFIDKATVKINNIADADLLINKYFRS